MENLCFCGNDLNAAGECNQGIFGGHRGNCVVCGKNDDLDMQRCCSAECDLIMDAWPIPCDECGLSVAPDQIHECGHCGDCICMGCLVEHAKGHSQL